MEEYQRKFHLKKNQAFQSIYESDLTDLEKVAEGFRWITAKIIEQGEAEIELQRALGDRDAVIKEQIKVSTIRHAQSLFDYCRVLAARGGESSG
jgi:hypothetical protein